MSPKVQPEISFGRVGMLVSIAPGGQTTPTQRGMPVAKLEQKSANPPPGQLKHDTHFMGTLDQSSYDTHGTSTTTDDEMYFGDGNRPTNYNISVDSKTGIEL